ncbi:RAI1-domain-containing protein [Trichodelitschia bisporula]|uniref:Decapping nuclease n=1 Tax=Trichodelitschia bisporula TaxID=703511 RepID=A0A6G1I8V7_9PEZI|nr:RAI1-domain-containing protein [Trichodelitschia bisporula]
MSQIFHFPLQPLQRFTSGGAAAIKMPKEITHFSYDDRHEYRPDDSSMTYYYPPELGVDLSAGFKDFVKLDDTRDDHLEGLLRALMTVEEKEGKLRVVDFITWRGMMTKIMTTPYDNFDGFEMNATRFQVCYSECFIEEDHAAKLARVREQNANRRRPPPGAPTPDVQSYWGYKFETLSVIPDIMDNVSRDYIETRPKMVVNNHAQYCSVVMTGFTPTSMILGGEVDAIWDRRPDDPDQPINWVELKTSQEIYNDGDRLRFERKLCKFWAQSFLLGVPKIIVGYRTRDGLLKRLEELNTRTIPGMVKRKGNNSWDGNLCINFAAAFLKFLKETITSEGVWKIRRQQKSPVIEVFQTEAQGTGEILSKEFLEWRTQRYPQKIAQMLN